MPVINVQPKGQRVFAIAPTHYVFSTVYYDSQNGSQFLIDATANDAVTFSQDGTAITTSLSTSGAPAGFKYVVLNANANATSGDVTVITQHPGQVAGAKV